MKVTINYKGQSVWCYGVLNDDNNIEMVYNSGQFADYVDNCNYNTDKPFKNWTEAVHYLIDLDRFGEIDELSPC